MTRPLVALVCLALASPALAKGSSAPEWSSREVDQLLGLIQQAARTQPVAAKDAALAQAAGGAYRVAAKRGESTERYAKRILRKREPDHFNVKKGQWLTALTRRLYLDLSKRCRFLMRFETDRRKRQRLEQTSKDAARIAEMLAERLDVVIQGLEEATEPLPAVGGAPATEIGVVARVHSGGTITIQRLDRVRFEGHQPPDDRPRTKNGALKEVYGAQQQFNRFAQTIGKYDSAHRKQGGHVQVILPAAYPAIYLNEIVHGGQEAKMHTLHLKTMTPKGELRELVLDLRPDKKTRARKKRGAKTAVVVTCADEMPMATCAKKLKHASLQGKVRYRIP